MTEVNTELTDDFEKLSEEDKLLEIKEHLSTELQEKVPDSLLILLLELNKEELKTTKKFFIPKLTEVLNNGVRMENIETAKENLSDEVKFSKLNRKSQMFLDELIEFSVVETSFFDVEKTLETRKEAANKLEPVVIRAGDIIVREDQIITSDIYEQLKLVGLLNDQKNLFPGIGLLILTLFLVLVMSYEINRLARKEILDNKKIYAIISITFIVLALMKVVSIYTTQTNQMYLLVPIATGVLLLKQIVNERFSIVMASVYAILGSVIFNSSIPGSLNIEALIYFYFFQMAGIILLTDLKERTVLIRASFGMALVNTLTILAFSLISFEKYSIKEFLIQSGFGVSSAFVVAVLTLGLLPIFETSLGILSDNKLLTLANPNQPLLKKILTETPGTYHHSVMVANLSETACEAIGANGLLARVGSYYHDIGKTLNPHYFIENQVGMRNPHDFISPEKSARIIIDHVIDGGKMLDEHNLPKEIKDICMQHHGTSLVGYFYHQAKEKDPNISEALFRYPGPKPQTKEAGVISICDSVEAAVRSMADPTEAKINELVRKIIEAKLSDGQFDETPLTMKDFNVIHYTVCEGLKGIFHSRIEYPEDEEK